MTALTAVLADDHGVVRAGLRALLQAGGIDVVGEALDGEQAVALALETRPDVVLLDLEMPRLGGLDALRLLRSQWPEVRVLVLTMHEGDDAVFAAVQTGARGYVVKHADPQEVLRAVHAVAAGEALFSASVAGRVLAAFSAGSTPSALPFPALTAREREVLDLVARGRTNSEIARVLVVSPKTIRNHLTSILAKLQVEGRAQAVAVARDAGLGASPTSR